MKKLLLFGLLLSLSLSITGCDNDSDNSKSVFTENDVINDPLLLVDIATSTIVTYLEPPNDDENGTPLFSILDDGERGTDIFPIFLSETTIITICWEDDVLGAEHTLSIVDSEGNETLFHQANEDCVSELVEPGDYSLLFTHDGKTQEELTIYLRPLFSLLDTQTKSFFKFLPHFIKDAYAQNAELGLLITTDSCEQCNLRQGDFQFADLGGNNLKNADLTSANFSNANLYQADLDGAITTNADFSLATAPNGGTFPPGSRGSPDLNSDEHTITLINNCNEAVWAGIIFGTGQPFLPVNGGPPLWGPNDTPSWQISSMQTRTLSLPFGFKSAVITPRTGCVLDNMCCMDSSGKSCNLVSCETDSDCSGGDNTCVEGAALRCKVGTCNDYNNCGSAGGAEPATTFEMSLDQAQKDGSFVDFYNVSMVAGNHIRVKIELSDPLCPSVGVCGSEPVCPWNRLVQKQVIPGQDDKIGILANFSVADNDEVGVCLGPDKMVGNSRFATLMAENPFQNIMPVTDEFRRLGCVASEAPNTDKVCGATSLENIFYGCSPFAVNSEIHMGEPAPPDGSEFGGCLSAFGINSGCTLDNCQKTVLSEKGLNDNKNAYSVNQICDPYGQCDQERNKIAKWPDGVWPAGCTVPGCTPGGPVQPTDYLESVKAACGKFDPNDQTFDPLKKGAYSWQFDDPVLPGLSGALGGCKSPKVNYTVTFCTD